MNNPFESIESRLSSMEAVLLDINHRINLISTDSALPEILSVKQAAELLAVSVPTLYSYVQQGTIPSMKQRKRLYFSRTEITEWLRQGRRAANTELSALASTGLTSITKGGTK